MLLTTTLFLLQAYGHREIMSAFKKVLTVYLFCYVICASSFQIPLRGPNNDGGVA